jgi:hypothetical protein
MKEVIELASKDEIDNIARALLKQSKALGIFPTPIDDIIQCADLCIDKNVDLSNVDSNFLSKNILILKSALSKVLGIAIPKKKIIYLDHSLPPARMNFVKLHETGHHVLPWQSGLLEAYEDDNFSLSEFIKKSYEQEASYFASTVLFQIDRFSELSKHLPLSLNSAMALAQQFGASNHAAIRRYVEYSQKRCALLVLELPKNTTCKMRNYFASESFTNHFGIIEPCEQCGLEYSFVNDIILGIKNNSANVLQPFEGSIFSYPLNYEYFSNHYNVFVLLYPVGEYIRSQTIIQVKI